MPIPPISEVILPSGMKALHPEVAAALDAVLDDPHAAASIGNARHVPRILKARYDRRMAADVVSDVPADEAEENDDATGDENASSDCDNDDSGFHWWHGAIAVAVLGVAVAAYFIMPVKEWLMLAIEWVDSFGWVGPAVFVAFYIPAVVIGLPSTPLNIGSGLLFGAWIGAAATTAGAVMGGIIAFFLARYVIGDWVQEKLECYPTCDAVLDGCEEEPWKFVSLLRVHPLLPSALKNYCLGTTEVRWWVFAICTALACIPIRVVYAYLGSAGHMSLTSGEEGTSTTQWIIFGVGLAVAIGVTAGMTWLARKQLKDFEESSNRNG